MAKGFSPLIGLAVVVALAMVAVFGALSLNNATPVLAQESAQIKTPTFDSGSKTPGRLRATIWSSSTIADR